MAEKYEGEDLNYNMAYHKVQEVNQVDMMVAAKSFKLFTVDWKVDHENSVDHVFVFFSTLH